MIYGKKNYLSNSTVENVLGGKSDMFIFWEQTHKSFVVQEPTYSFMSCTAHCFIFALFHYLTVLLGLVCMYDALKLTDLCKLRYKCPY